MNPMNITCCASFNAGCGTEIKTPVYSPMNEYLAAEEILERKESLAGLLKDGEKLWSAIGLDDA